MRGRRATDARDATDTGGRARPVVPRATAAALALAAVLATGSVRHAAAQEAPGEDGRQAIVLPERARATVLREMRMMLEALGGVLRHAVEMDRAAMREAALSGGTRIAVDTDPAVAERLPEAFVRLGSSTHRDFDALAGAIEAGAGRDSVLARLGRLTSKCVSCHASYRVATPGDDGR